MRELYVSPDGQKSRVAGTREEPFGSLEQALGQVREWKRLGHLDGETTIWMQGGEYTLTAPIRITPDDSAPVAIKAMPGEKPVLSGGQRITGFTPVRVNGADGWRAAVPEVLKKGWNFRQLFVNGTRRERSRYPQEGFLWIEKDPDLSLDTPFGEALFHGNDRFQYAPGDIRDWHNLQDIDILVHHYWIQERLPLASIDPETRLAIFQRRSVFGLKDDVHPRYSKYYVENIFEELNQPGQWYLDRQEGALYYLPLPGETIETADVVAPILPQLLELAGDAQSNRYVEYLRFEGLTFRYGAWEQPSVKAYFRKDAFLQRQAGSQDKDFAESPQAASHVPGCLALSGARHITFSQCTIEHVGWYACEVGESCHGIQILGCTLRDLGAGGVKINGGRAEDPALTHTTAVTIADCEISDGGHLAFAACGILAMHSAWNRFVHNHIHDFYYSGISCGWVWGYAPSSSHHNEMGWNHIHDLGKGQLSDMGGIYTLGEQPGTTIHDNYIHDVVKSNYGGWGVYLDEGSSHIIVERNLCVNLSSQGFHQHYGRENMIRNNILAFGQEGQLAITRPEAHVSITLERNILLADGIAIFAGNALKTRSLKHFRCDLNLYFDKGRPAAFMKDDAGWDEWHAAGQDNHSLIADPQLELDGKGRVRIAPDSPALSLGFEPFSLEGAGPRQEGV